MTLTPPPGAPANGYSAEWILEAPDSDLPVSSLPKFTPLTFNAAIACGINKAVTGPQNALIFDIEDTSGNVLTSTTVGIYTATISFLG